MHPSICTLLIFPLLAACGKAQVPVYDDDIGVTAIPVDSGSLAGRFALAIRVANLVDAPLIGKTEGGSMAAYLLERSYDPERGRYTQTQQQCSGVVEPVAGNKTTIDDRARQKVPPSTTHSLLLEDGTGRYQVIGHLELWGLKQLPDLYETPLPADKDEARQPPHADRIFDMDRDGNPGVTARIQGIVSGEQYFIQRRIVHLKGVTLGADHLIGLAEDHSEQVALGGSNALLASQSEVIPDPNPLLSWFDERRLDAAAGCAAVKALLDAGTLGFERPF